MNAKLVLALSFTTLVQVGVALAVLFLPRGRPVGFRRFLLSVLACMTALVVIVVALVPFGLRLFGILNLAYVTVFIAVPCVGVIVLGAARRGARVTWPVRVVAVLGLLLALLGVWVTWIEPRRLEVVRTDVSLAPEREGREPITVGVLADLQTITVGDYEREVVARLVALEPDVIVIPGDIYQGEYEDFHGDVLRFRELLAGLRAPGGVYFAPGNCDVAYQYEELFHGTGIQVLVDEWVEVRVRDRRLTIAGCDAWFQDPGPRELAGELELLPGKGDVRLLVSHFPGSVHNLLRDTRVDLVIAGHTHGGQVQLPFFGPPLTLSFVPRRVAAGGLHVLDGKRVYVSRGVGMERKQAPRLRFLCRPEISLLTLR